MDQEKSEERLLEEQHLLSCLEVVRENIRVYTERESAYKKEVTQLFQAVKKGEGDSYGQLVAGQNILEYTQNVLRKNRAALKKAYFGRIDYEDLTFGGSEVRYIGKNGVNKGPDEIVIVDWRAPVCSVYYENEPGMGSYQVPGSGTVEIDLHKKRTYDIEEEDLLGYYDDDTAANDELLVKYLSQNKEAVLGDIIATIQKEQNEIIRDVPWKNMIVQGVAGSGKTTVALHRISYLLYNYEDKYKPSEFCIVGSSDMLLGYIGSGLPELDVNHVKQMRTDRFLTYLMGKAWKKSYSVIPDDAMAPVKSKLDFIRKLENFLGAWRRKWLEPIDITDRQIGCILSRESMGDILDKNSRLSMFQAERLLNRKISARIEFLCSDWEKGPKKEKQAAYKKYFDLAPKKWTEVSIYREFLEYLEREENTPGRWEETVNHVSKGRMDVYDTAALALIWKRILMKKEEDEFSQIIIDEAQDFGETIYHVMRQILPDCYFTVMGDVSQNIRYETGMNDWEDLKEVLFEQKKDSFYLLSKSYRNTIEISNFAGKVLEKASKSQYQIQPVIRHGKEVTVIREKPEQLAQRLQSTVDSLKEQGYETIAVICREEKDAAQVKEYLGVLQKEQGEQEELFHNGVMVLPVTLTKGLEFDAVILWRPDEEHYGDNSKEAKLLYVAMTRALHELYLIGDQEISPLFG
ncbi:MAG: ATP-binding domain-containing protein [Coprococcus sp.]|nr:ATP-binding domain-containing protein [Coprococcus sp.]